jgi:hypothetical protein
LGGEVGKLGLKGAHHIGGGIGNIAAELKNAQGFTARGSGHAFGVGVKANAQHAALRSPCRLELLGKVFLARVHWFRVYFRKAVIIYRIN